MSNRISAAERLRSIVSSISSYASRERGYLARIEFWVYLTEPTLPSQEEIMDRMMRANPYVHGPASIGPAEGILFSDVRTHFALMRKENNAPVFRGSNFPETVSPSGAQLETIRASSAVAKVSYISEQPLSTLTHVSFVTHAAVAIADLTGSSLVYDLTTERLVEVEQFRTLLARDPTASSSDFHVRTLWEISGGGNKVETRGLRKVGIPELRTTEMGRDQRVISEGVVGEAVSSLWKSMQLARDFQVELFADTFRIEVARRNGNFADVRLLRVNHS